MAPPASLARRMSTALWAELVCSPFRRIGDGQRPPRRCTPARNAAASLTSPATTSTSRRARQMRARSRPRMARRGSSSWRRTTPARPFGRRPTAARGSGSRCVSVNSHSGGMAPPNRACAERAHRKRSPLAVFRSSPAWTGERIADWSAPRSGLWSMATRSDVFSRHERRDGVVRSSAGRRVAGQSLERQRMGRKAVQPGHGRCSAQRSQANALAYGIQYSGSTKRRGIKRRVVAASWLKDKEPLASIRTGLISDGDCALRGSARAGLLGRAAG